MSTEIDVAQIKRAAHDAIPLTFKTYTLPHETEIYLDKVLENFLAELGQEKLKEPLSYCLRELAVNAKKANTKRVYFQEKKLDLNKDVDYDFGMKTFKQETFDNIQHYLQKQKELGLYIKVIFQTKGKTLSIMVRNNVEITRKEQIRVYDRLARSRAFTSLEEAFATVLDSSEGAGLGIVILVLMMKKIGLSEDCFAIESEDGETVASITIPFSEIHLEQLDVLTQILVKEVDTLPQFPENIINLQKLLADPNHELNDIAREISVDPSMTADLLKLVNSAQFMLPKRVDNIVEAVKLVGTKGVRNLLYSYGTQKILGEKYSEMRSMWSHAYRVAFYAYMLARSFKKKKELLDDVYVGGHPPRPRPDRHRLAPPGPAGADHAHLQGEGHSRQAAGGLLRRPQPRGSRRADRQEVELPRAARLRDPLPPRADAGPSRAPRHRLLRLHGECRLRPGAREDRFRPDPSPRAQGLRDHHRGPARADPGRSSPRRSRISAPSSSRTWRRMSRRPPRRFRVCRTGAAAT